MSAGAIKLRPAQAADNRAIEEVHLASFETGAEAKLAGALERDGSIVLSLVAATNDEIAGSIIFSRLLVDGRDQRAVALAPLAVLPHHRRKGVAALLVREGHRLLTEAGERLVLVLGDPDYYRRFGFSEEAARDLWTPYDGPYLMALRLDSGGGSIAGDVTYPAAFAALE